MVAKLKKDRLNLTIMTQLRALCMDPSMVNDSSFVALSHWWRVCGSQIKQKRQVNLTLMTFD